MLHMPSAVRILTNTLLLSLAVASFDTAEAASSDKKPRWEDLSKVIDAYFAQVSGHIPNGIITQTEIEPLWDKLAKAKWQISQADRDEITKLIPTNKEFLVKQLHTSKGRSFMRKVASKYPEIYDRLDRLARTSGGGRPAVSGLIAAPDADLTVKYMFSKGGEQSWAALMPDKKTFNKPTGRIYTAEALKSRLQELYQSSQ
jgi:hypothetical protein